MRPEKGEARGTGTRSRFSIFNLLELAIVKEMVNFGLDLDNIKRIKTQMDGFKVPEKKIKDKNEIGDITINN